MASTCGFSFWGATYLTHCLFPVSWVSRVPLYMFIYKLFYVHHHPFSSYTSRSQFVKNTPCFTLDINTWLSSGTSWWLSTHTDKPRILQQHKAFIFLQLSRLQPRSMALATIQQIHSFCKPVGKMPASSPGQTNPRLRTILLTLMVMGQGMVMIEVKHH